MKVFNLRQRGPLPMIRDKYSIEAVLLLRYGGMNHVKGGKPVLNIRSVASACGISSSHAR